MGAQTTKSLRSHLSMIYNDRLLLSSRNMGHFINDSLQSAHFHFNNLKFVMTHQIV